MRLVGWLVCRVGRGAHSKRAIRASRVWCYNPITWVAEVIESRVKASLGYR